MIEIKIGDCTERLKDLKDNSVDAIICDPPYGLKFMSKGWDDIGEGSQQREWHRKWLTQAHRILKPKGVLKAFSGTRTYHHLIAMMEEIGFVDLRVEAWVYGSGFPKSHNVALGIDKKYGHGNRGRAIPTASRYQASDTEQKNKLTSNPVESYESKTEESKQWEGWGTALKPAWESICIGVKK
jgi:site-specific DNA-methyltransferase (adenine-specific)